MGKARQRTQAPRRRGKPPRPVVMEGLESRRLLSATAIGLATQSSAMPDGTASLSVGIQGYSPSQVASAYGFTSSVTTAGANGTGQTIAIVEAYHSKTLVSDLNVFDQQFDLPTVSLQ